MKPKSLFTLLLLLALLVPAAALAAGNWSLTLNAATSGGGASAGGNLALQGAAGQSVVGRSSSGALRLNSGLLGEAVSGGPRLLYLPLMARQFATLAWTELTESEPNNTFGTANLAAPLPVIVAAFHDGAANTGDVFALPLAAGPVLHAQLATGDTNGVQFLAYDPAGNEVLRDIEPPYSLVFAPTYAGTYYLYVFTPAGANNQAAYTLRIWTVGTQAEAQPVAPLLAPELLDLAPAILP